MGVDLAAMCVFCGSCQLDPAAPQDKPTGFLNVGGFFGPTVEQLDRMVAEGFVRQEHRDGIYVDDQPDRLLQRLASFESPDLHKWIDRDLGAG